MMRKVTNTTEELKNPLNALEFLATQMDNPEGTPIADMEAAGQREFIFSDVLPVDMSHNTQEEFEALGFKFGDVVESDPIFRYAELPEGWKKVGTGHNMWSTIVDESGKERVGIFYKAAFYDRHAHMFIHREQS
jgi:hypothetical protein